MTTGGNRCTEDIGSRDTNGSNGSGAAGQLRRQQSFEPDVGPGAIERLLTEVQPPLDGAVVE